MSLHERHVIGPQGLPVRHRTVPVVRALQAGLASYTFRFDRRDASVQVSREATAREPRPDVGGFTGVELCFPWPLRMGDRVAGVPDGVRLAAVPPQLCRAARTPVRLLEIRVAFTPERLPGELLRGLWDGCGPDARLRAAEPMELDDDCSAHRFTDEDLRRDSGLRVDVAAREGSAAGRGLNGCVRRRTARGLPI